MGGRGSGGTRPGSGRKPKDAGLRLVQGDTTHRPAPSAPIAPVVDVPMPELPEAEAAVWASNAPHAMKQRTLTPETAESFREMCELVVRMRRLWAQIDTDGLIYIKVSVDGAGVEHQELKKHPLLPDYRGLTQRVEAARTRFRLAPIGKEMYTAEQPAANPLDRFVKKAQAQGG